jgi:hypothetical protein
MHSDKLCAEKIALHLLLNQSEHVTRSSPKGPDISHVQGVSHVQLSHVQGASHVQLSYCRHHRKRTSDEQSRYWMAHLDAQIDECIRRHTDLVIQCIVLQHTAAE